MTKASSGFDATDKGDFPVLMLWSKPEK